MMGRAQQPICQAFGAPYEPREQGAEKRPMPHPAPHDIAMLEKKERLRRSSSQVFEVRTKTPATTYIASK